MTKPASGAADGLASSHPQHNPTQSFDDIPQQFQRRKIAALRSEPLPWTGRRDPDNPLEGAVGFLDKTGRRHEYSCTCTMCFAAIVGDAA